MMGLHLKNSVFNTFSECFEAYPILQATNAYIVEDNRAPHHPCMSVWQTLIYNFTMQEVKEAFAENDRIFFSDYWCVLLQKLPNQLVIEFQNTALKIVAKSLEGYTLSQIKQAEELFKSYILSIRSKKACCSSDSIPIGRLEQNVLFCNVAEILQKKNMQ